MNKSESKIQWYQKFISKTGSEVEIWVNPYSLTIFRKTSEKEERKQYDTPNGLSLRGRLLWFRFSTWT